jgi:signal transduction histidine kinase
MLLVTRVDSAQLLRRRVIVPLDEVLDESIRDLMHDPVTHPIKRNTAGVEISGDPERLRDIFRNVLENAVKYSPEGGAIRIDAALRENQTVIEIADRGIGIAQEHLPYIFDRFYRVQSDTTASVGGSGLGLYIVHALVRAHGGTIDVRSAPDKGTTFVLRLPLR